MAVPFRRTSKTAKRKRRSHYKLSVPGMVICPNCGETEVGKYCPKCGQSNKDYNKPIKEIVGDLLDSINLVSYILVELVAC